MSELYRGYRIEIQTNELPEGIGWRAFVSVEKHDGEGVSASVREFINGTFLTDSDARAAALLHGRRMVDQRIG